MEVVVVMGSDIQAFIEYNKLFIVNVINQVEPCIRRMCANV
jgi:hypothetical protein